MKKALSLFWSDCYASAQSLRKQRQTQTEWLDANANTSYDVRAKTPRYAIITNYDDANVECSTGKMAVEGIELQPGALKLPEVPKL